VKLRSGVAAARLRGKAFGSGTQLLDHWHNSPVAWRARGWERGTGKTPPWLEPSVFRLRWGSMSGRIGISNNRRSYRATAPLRGGFGVSGVSLCWSHLQKNSRDTVPQKLQANKTYGYRTGGNLPTDQQKGTSPLAPLKSFETQARLSPCRAGLSLPSVPVS
jgi:hypothetical protein